MKLLLSALTLCACVAASRPALAGEPSSFDQTHAAWTKVLKQIVAIDGPRSRINYRDLKKHHENLKLYLAQVETVSGSEFAKFTESQKLAFLINAYNAFTVKLILDHYPVKSIRDIGGLFSSPWKIKFFKLLGEEHHLDDIEHEMIRKKFNEPRIHFALVCASKGCPALRNEAFISGKLESQLESAAETFLRDASRNRFDPQAHILYLSSIFKWYGGDFEKKFGSIKAFVSPRMAMDNSVGTAIMDETTKIEFLDYDWSLNE